MQDPIDAIARTLPGPCAESALALNALGMSNAIGIDNTGLVFGTRTDQSSIRTTAFARIEISGDDHPGILSQFSNVSADNLCSLKSGLATSMIEVRVDESELPTPVALIAQPRPTGDSRKRGVPTFAAGFAGRLRKPKGTRAE